MKNVCSDLSKKSRDAILPFFAEENFNLESEKIKSRKFITCYQKSMSIHCALRESKHKILTIFDEQKISINYSLIFINSELEKFKCLTLKINI